MAPEAPQPDYIEKAKLYDTAEHEMDILKDPTKFDEAALRKEFRNKLDAARGNKLLTSPDLLKKYDQALKKIDENIARLKEVSDYAVNKLKVSEKMKEYKTEQKFSNYPEFLRVWLDYQKMNKFMGAKFKTLICNIDRDNFKGELTETLLSMSGAIDKYMVNYVNKEGMELVEKVNAAWAGRGEVTIADYSALDGIIDTIKDFQRDDFIGAKDPYKLTIDAYRQMTLLYGAQDRAYTKMDKQAQALVDNIKKTRESQDKDRLAWTNSMDKYSLAVLKVRAVNAKQEAAEYGATAPVLEDGDKLYLQAVESVKTNAPFEKPLSLFNKAIKEYNSVRDFRIALGAEKKPLDEGTDLKMASK